MRYFNNREDLISFFPKKCIFAEIGVFQGTFSKLIYKFLDPEELHLIDLFEGSTCSGDKDGNNVITVNLNHEFNVLKNFYKDVESVKLHKGTSKEILNLFPDDYFDIIYIDGDHSYEGVTVDLNLARKKVKPNGIISGHDYSFAFLPVMKAVDNFIKENNLKIDYITLDKLPSFGIINNK